MKDLLSVVFDHEETIQDSEGQGRHSEEVHGGDDLVVIAKESSPEFPCLLGRRQVTEIPRDGAFGAVKAEFKKFAVNSRCAPSWIL